MLKYLQYMEGDDPQLDMCIPICDVCCECSTSDSFHPPQDHLPLVQASASQAGGRQFKSRSSSLWTHELRLTSTGGQLYLTMHHMCIYMLRSGHPGLRYQGCSGLAPGNAERHHCFSDSKPVFRHLKQMMTSMTTLQHIILG